jgi:hypothetical protein
MENGVEARFASGGLFLTCDEEAFARLRAYIAAEPSVAKATRGAIESPGVRFISVRQPSPESGTGPARPGLLTLIPAVIGSCISGVALVVGFVTIAQWLMRLAA